MSCCYIVLYYSISCYVTLYNFMLYCTTVPYHVIIYYIILDHSIAYDKYPKAVSPDDAQCLKLMIDRLKTPNPPTPEPTERNGY